LKYLPAFLTLIEILLDGQIMDVQRGDITSGWKEKMQYAEF
jgi:hypothetical protein